MYCTTSIPIKYIESLEVRQHLMLFYEDPEYARLIEFLFLKHGLESHEDCIYATDEDSGMIVLRLLRYGIPLDAFLSKKIQVFQLRPISGKPDQMLTECKKEVTRILSGIRRPFRMVSRIVSDVTTIDGMSVELDLERCVHECFDDFGGTLMCPYDISMIEKTKKLEWVNALYSTHHAVIYIPKNGEGGVICPC